jgi:hypothetical protein
MIRLSCCLWQKAELYRNRATTQQNLCSFLIKLDIDIENFYIECLRPDKVKLLQFVED